MNVTEIWIDVSGDASGKVLCWAAVAVRDFADVRGPVTVTTGTIDHVNREHAETTAARKVAKRFLPAETACVFHSDHQPTVDAMRAAGFDFRIADKRSAYHVLAHTAAGGERYRRLYMLEVCAFGNFRKKNGKIL